MGRNLVEIKKSRKYSDEFKKEIVRLFEQGRYSVPQLERLYLVCNASIYNWIYKFSNYNKKGIRIVEMKESHQHKLTELEKRVKELEQMVGQKQIKIDFLEKMIELADDHFNIDIKKNSSTKPSTGSKSIEKKKTIR